jgi:pimeloyl-ACP methyl ester carboxylesterase/DNA-binding CsgD family transcriptional regulator
VTPVIRYCASPAGRIAWSALGSGPPLLIEPGWVTHLTGQLELFDFSAFLARLTRLWTVIRYDKPGCGLSDRDGVDLSFDSQVAAAMAVADAAGAARFAMFGASQGGQIAAAIAARHPDRVQALALYGTCADGADLAPSEVRESIVALVRAHWGIGSKLMTGIFVADPSAADVEEFRRLQRDSATSQVAADMLASYYGTSVRDMLPQITAPTTVLHREQDSAARFRLGREVAALIPGAALVPLPGRGHLFYQGDWQPGADALVSFLQGTGGPRPRLTPRELEVARLICQGMTDQAIASRLTIAPRTAAAHAENIRRKLDVRSRAQVAAWMAEHDPRMAAR